MMLQQLIAKVQQQRQEQAAARQEKWNGVVATFAMAERRGNGPFGEQWMMFWQQAVEEYGQ